MKHISDFMDEAGFVGHIGSDGKLEFGDGALRLGQLYGSLYAVTKSEADRQKFISCCGKLFQWGEPVRYPDRSMWYGQPGTMSRDNLIGIITAGVIVGYHSYNSSLSQLLSKRFYFAWNTKGIWETKGWSLPDIIGPSTYRLLEPNMGYLSRCFLDMFSVLHALFQIIIFPFNKDHTSPVQTEIMCILARRVNPTFVSKIAEWIYLKGFDWRLALTNYFDGPNNPPLNDLMITAVENHEHT